MPRIQHAGVQEERRVREAHENTCAPLVCGITHDAYTTQVCRGKAGYAVPVALTMSLF